MRKFGSRVLRGLAASRRDVGTAVGVAAIVLGLVLGSPKLWHGTNTTLAVGDVGTAPATAPSSAPSVAPTDASTVGATNTPGAKNGRHPGQKNGATPSAGTTPSPVTSSYHRQGGNTTIGKSNGSGLQSGGSSAPPAQLPMSAGVTNTSVSVGIGYDINGSAYGSAFGIKVSDVDQKAQAQGIVDYLNAHGGVAGRKIIPVWHAVDLVAQLHGSNELQKTCDAFTQDATVFAAVGDVQSECLLQGHVVQINEAVGADDSYAKYPDYDFSPSAFDESGIESAIADGLKAGGFFNAMPSSPGCSASGPKVGAVGFDLSKKQVMPLVTKAYKAVGITIAKWGFVTADSSNVQQVMLDFKAACITHIITPEYSPLLLAQAAESQAYRPLWGIGSTQSPQLLQANTNANQLANFYGSGWSPSSDVDAAHDPGPIGPDAKLCVSIMRAQHLPTDRGSMAVAYPVCDELFVLKAAFDHASALTPPGFRAAYEAIGPWDSTVTFAARLGPSTHAGAIGYRPMRVVHGAWTYTGGIGYI